VGGCPSTDFGEEKQMIIKLLFFGEAVNIPATTIGLGVGAISVWVDGAGFTSATNDLGALGYMFVETQDVDIGEPGPELQDLFSNLHGQVVDFQIKTNLFIRSGGIARITMTRSVEQGGVLVDKKIEFQATDCKGVSVVSNPVSFSTEMIVLERSVASLDEVVSDDDLVAIVEAAPPAVGVG
jgi:hypothetical protein